jgi:hypothetical protein
VLTEQRGQLGKVFERPHHRRVCGRYLARQAVPRLLVENACGQHRG